MLGKAIDDIKSDFYKCDYNDLDLGVLNKITKVANDF